MTSLILWGLIAFLIVDILALVLVLRWNDNGTRSVKESRTINRGATKSQATAPAAPTAKMNVLGTAKPDEPTTPLTTASQPARGEHIFTLDLPHDEQNAKPAHHSSPSSVATAMPLSNNGLDEGQTSRERSFLCQKANNLETRIAALNENTETMTDYQRGMRAVLEEELHTTWTHLGELESELGRANHATTK